MYEFSDVVLLPGFCLVQLHYLLLCFLSWCSCQEHFRFMKLSMKVLVMHSVWPQMAFSAFSRLYINSLIITKFHLWIALLLNYICIG